jgi:hypothetical protein
MLPAHFEFIEVYRVFGAVFNPSGPAFRLPRAGGQSELASMQRALRFTNDACA